MIRFPYKSYVLEPGGGSPSETIHRPVVPVRFAGLGGHGDFLGLLDTGADETILDISLVDQLDIPVKPQGRLVLRSSSDHEFEAVVGTVDIAVGSGELIYRWHAAVLFAYRPDLPALLGIRGFLEHFDVQFSGGKKMISMRPAGDLPPAIMPGLPL